MVNNIFLALGSNKGNRPEFLREAVLGINEDPFCRVLKYSSLYETTPYGNLDQPDFLNAVIEIESDYLPEKLLKVIKELERKIGRADGTEKWGQREIDVDIIFYNDVIYTDDKIIIPHPECLKRDFVIIPLLEIAPHFIHPEKMKRIDGLDISSLEKHIIHKKDFSINL